MYSVNIELAGFVCRIESEYRLSVGLYRSFQTDASHDFSITLTANDICIIERAGKSFPGIITEHILQKVTDALIDFNTLLIHGVAIALDKCAYLFAASSGTGKTTHCELWQEKQRDTVFINGDKPFIRFHADGSQPLVCGSPWAGKEDMYTNTMIPLKDIVLMERAEDNHIEQISFAEAFPGLLQQVYRPDDEEKMRKTLRLMQRLSPAVTFWRFQCNNFKDDCFDVAYNALVKGQP